MRAVDASGGQLSGREQGKAGMIMGIIGTVLLVLGVLATIVVIALALSVDSSSSSGSTY